MTLKQVRLTHQTILHYWWICYIPAASICIWRTSLADSTIVSQVSKVLFKNVLVNYSKHNSKYQRCSTSYWRWNFKTLEKWLDSSWYGEGSATLPYYCNCYNYCCSKWLIYWLALRLVSGKCPAGVRLLYGCCTAAVQLLSEAGVWLVQCPAGSGWW
jgi:hypothetical protein